MSEACFYLMLEVYFHNDGINNAVMKTWRLFSFEVDKYYQLFAINEHDWGSWKLEEPPFFDKMWRRLFSGSYYLTYKFFKSSECRCWKKYHEKTARPCSVGCNHLTFQTLTNNYIIERNSIMLFDPTLHTKKSCTTNNIYS